MIVSYMIVSPVLTLNPEYESTNDITLVHSILLSENATVHVEYDQDPVMDEQMMNKAT